MPETTFAGHPRIAGRTWRAMGLAALTLLLLAGGGCAIEKTVKDALGGMSDRLFPDTPREAVEKAFASYDPDERRRATAMISAAPFGGEEKYVRFYREMLKTEPDPTVRAVLLRALGDHGEPEDALTIAAYLDADKHPVFIRWEAAKALRKLHNPEVTDELLAAMRNGEDPGVRAAAADALGQYPSPTVFQALVGGLDDKHFSVILASESSLRTLTGADLGLDGGKWLAWADEHSNNLFANQQTYTWMPYVKPKGFMDKVQFWKKGKDPGPTVPAGLAAEDESGKKEAAADEGKQVSTTSG